MKKSTHEYKRSGYDSENWFQDVLSNSFVFVFSGNDDDNQNDLSVLQLKL